jgi:Protein kinase domain.
MWSFGCLLCELYSGYPIFAGDSEQDQLFSIMEVLGFPDKELIEVRHYYLLFYSPRKGQRRANFSMRMGHLKLSLIQEEKSECLIPFQ